MQSYGVDTSMPHMKKPIYLMTCWGLISRDASVLIMLPFVELQMLSLTTLIFSQTSLNPGSLSKVPLLLFDGHSL